MVSEETNGESGLSPLPRGTDWVSVETTWDPEVSPPPSSNEEPHTKGANGNQWENVDFYVFWNEEVASPYSFTEMALEQDN